MNRSSFALVGLGTMGRNLALNMEEHGVPVAVWNLETEWTDAFVREHQGARFTGARTLEELAAALERPRRIMMLIKAGAPVDQMIDKLSPLLDAGRHPHRRRQLVLRRTRAGARARCARRGLHFVGCGVSGGEEGARRGPSLMPGGSDAGLGGDPRRCSRPSRPRPRPGPCVTHVGPDGAGHFVKMVHNGIEYGDMQLIAEAYDVLRRGLGLSRRRAGDVFDGWNERRARVVPDRD